MAGCKFLFWLRTALNLIIAGFEIRPIHLRTYTGVHHKRKRKLLMFDSPKAGQIVLRGVCNCEYYIRRQVFTFVMIGTQEGFAREAIFDLVNQ